MMLILNTIVPVFGVMALGFWLTGRRELHIPTLADLALLVTSPALVFSVLSEMTLSPERSMTLFSGTVWIVAGTGVLATLYVFSQRGELRGLIPPALFWNSGNMGLPCAQFAFGPEGLEAAVIPFVTVAVLQFSLGIWIAKGRGGWLEALRLPLVYACLAGLVVGATDIVIPNVIMAPVKMVGDMAIPLMLLNLGIQLRRLQVTDVQHSVVAVAIRVLGGPAAALLFVELFGVDGVDRQVLLLGSVMPAAVANVVIAQRYGSNPSLVASAIVIGTLASLVTIPTILYFIA
jgi:predicted permease